MTPWLLIISVILFFILVVLLILWRAIGEILTVLFRYRGYGTALNLLKRRD